ncbi:hypothetical protein PAXRUDRAFT_168149 [Paxillus rubicundulus Ve08.2h10]|uniref:Uncharacterized protein n=1 Tax=Paxillus rubicundulus Ve08.2h10 TaxID=930991 RepID=A0A0D0CP11_9AGAM|nr:hypothetical protein PAXRUDRAFT_168149 [Paxillus rubicundulus Ve08.2h10]
MSVPPVPPRPVEYSARNSVQSKDQPPPVPPLPPELIASSRSQPSPPPSLPHFDIPLAAPRSHRLYPDLPASVRLVYLMTSQCVADDSVFLCRYINRWQEL